MGRMLSFVVVIFGLFAFCPLPALAEKRVALVIGNNQYGKLPADRQLERAVADARTMTVTLEKLGFTVTRGENLDRAAMVDRISAFTRQIEEGDIALFFYAGHGVALGGGNYLLPTDIPLPQAGEEGRMRNLAIGEADIIADIQEHKARVAVLLLDACRDNPFRQPGLLRSVGRERGLVRSNEGQGIFAIYSAGFGESALDRLGPDDKSPNSVFTRALAPILSKPGLHLGDVAYEVREEVARMSATIGHVQVPAYYDQTRGGRVYLAGLPKPGAAGVGSDEVAWDYLKSSNDTASLRKFLADFPGSVRKAEAETRIAALEAAVRSRAEASEEVRRQVARSVVTIHGKGPASPKDQFMHELLGNPDPARSVRSAAGVIVDPAGIIVTANVVPDNMTDLRVVLPDDREFQPEVLLKDVRNNIAVLRIGACETLPAIAFGNSDDVRFGDTVTTISSPKAPTPVATMHVVAPISRAQLAGDFGYIQTDYTADPGTAGAAVVDGAGHLVGIIAGMQVSDLAGVGFTIPINGVKIVVARAIAKPPRRPWLGASLQNLTPALAKELGVRTGVLVANLPPGGPAARAGLRSGDLIVSIDNAEVANINTFTARFNIKPPCSEAQLGIIRSNKDLRLAVLVQPPPDGDPDELTIQGKSPFMGVKVSNLTPALADDLRLDLGAEGVIVTEVSDGSTAAALGLKRGDIVVQVNDAKIKTTRDLDRITNQPAKIWRLTITRDGQSRILSVRG
jgi:S1-C subfamily serine protease